MREAELKALLRKILRADQLAELLQTSRLQHLVDKVPPYKSISAEQYIAEVVDELERDGTLDKHFFVALEHYRPHRKPEIRQVAVQFIEFTDEDDNPDQDANASDADRADDRADDPSITTTAGPAWPPIDTPAGPAEPELRPTLGEWCRLQRRPLISVFAIPLIVLLIAYFLLSLSPSTHAKFAAKPSFIFVMACQIGQMFLCGQALIVFAGWVGPGAPSTFGLSQTYRQFYARQKQAERGDRKLRAALGADSSEESIKEWLKGARRGGQQTSELLVVLWLAWAILYFCLVASDVTETLGIDLGQHWRFTINACTTMMNNAAAGVMLILFWVMTYVTVPIEGVGVLGQVPRRNTRLRFRVTGVVLAIFLLQLVVVNAVPEAARKDWDWFFGLVSGLGSAVIMALLFGRFDSKLLSVPLSALVCLYIWAAIQPTWPVLDLIHVNHNPERDLFLQDIAQVVMYGYAWAAKCLFFVLCAWLFHTGRFEFFYLRLRRLQTSVAEDWQQVTR